jgi:predicted nucleic acid-binding protein
LKISVDSNIFIEVKNKELRHESSKSILDRIDAGSLVCVVSAVVVAEMCAGYHLAGELEEKDDFLAHIEASQNYEVVDLSMGVADLAGRIRAETGLKLPDAVIVASALHGKAECLVSNDDSLRKAERFMRVVAPKEFVKEKAE